jgi:hypothetical protein
MSRNRWLAVGVAVAIGLCLLLWTSRTTSAPAPADPGQTSFQGKVLLVRSGLYPADAYILEQGKVRTFGSHAFLVGKVVDAMSAQAAKGKNVWLNLANITSIVECEDADSAKKMLKALPQAVAPGIAIGGGVIEAVPVELPANVVPAPPPPAKALPRKP